MSMLGLPASMTEHWNEVRTETRKQWACLHLLQCARYWGSRGLDPLHPCQVRRGLQPVFVRSL